MSILGTPQYIGLSKAIFSIYKIKFGKTTIYQILYNHQRAHNYKDTL
jgi:hypothetical protein